MRVTLTILEESPQSRVTLPRVDNPRKTLEDKFDTYENVPNQIREQKTKEQPYLNSMPPASAVFRLHETQAC